MMPLLVRLLKSCTHKGRSKPPLKKFLSKWQIGAWSYVSSYATALKRCGYEGGKRKRLTLCTPLCIERNNVKATENLKATKAPVTPNNNIIHEHTIFYQSSGSFSNFSTDLCMCASLLLPATSQSVSPIKMRWQLFITDARLPSIKADQTAPTESCSIKDKLCVPIFNCDFKY